MNIDWSKAPEGFDFHLQGKGKRDTGKFYKAGEDRFLSEPGSYILYADMGELVDLFHVSTRPDVVVWNGEGLPPVGTTIEAHGPFGSQWRKVEVLAHYKGFAVCGYEEDDCSVFVDNFPPIRIRAIRTPEQIAAEERDKESFELFSVINWLDSKEQWDRMSESRKDDYRKAIDAGYRKFEIVEGE